MRRRDRWYLPESCKPLRVMGWCFLLCKHKGSDEERYCNVSTVCHCCCPLACCFGVECNSKSSSYVETRCKTDAIDWRLGLQTRGLGGEGSPNFKRDTWTASSQCRCKERAISMARLHQQQTDPEVLAQVAEVDAWACTGPRKNYIKSEEKSKQERQETREKVLN